MKFRNRMWVKLGSALTTTDPFVTRNWLKRIYTAGKIPNSFLLERGEERGENARKGKENPKIIQNSLLLLPFPSPLLRHRSEKKKLSFTAITAF
jgi:hypothetical protein